MTIVKPLESASPLNKKIIAILLVLVVCITIVEIWAVNRLATYGIQISQLEKTKTTLTLQNQVLENEIAQKSSLSYIEDDAKKLGFEHIKSILYLQNIGLALNH